MPAAKAKAVFVFAAQASKHQSKEGIQGMIKTPNYSTAQSRQTDLRFPLTDLTEPD